jgi:hypothetical protein
MGDVFGDGIFVTDGAQWKRSRHVLAPLFTVTTFKASVSICLLLRFRRGHLVLIDLGGDFGDNRSV